MRLGICQFDIQFCELELNFSRILGFIFKAAELKVDLLVFPESALAGYCFGTADEAASFALADDHPLLVKLQQKAQTAGVQTVVGYIERDGEKIYNTAGLFGGVKGIEKYRKIHTLVLGLDRFVLEGDLGFPTFSVGSGRIGINICYDQRFPESARTSMLNGAQLIVVPCNVHVDAQPLNTLLTRARAFENRVYYAWVNRTGTEKGIRFTGGSRIIDPYGKELLGMSADENDMQYIDIDLTKADEKKTVMIPGEYEVDLLSDRRPDMYQLN